MVKQTMTHTHHRIGYCLPIKRNELLTHETTWKNLKGILLSEEKTVPKGYRETGNDVGGVINGQHKGCLW